MFFRTILSLNNIKRVVSVMEVEIYCVYCEVGAEARDNSVELGLEIIQLN
jgi:hypothetical protein